MQYFIRFNLPAENVGDTTDLNRFHCSSTANVKTLLNTGCLMLVIFKKEKKFNNKKI